MLVSFGPLAEVKLADTACVLRGESWLTVTV